MNSKIFEPENTGQANFMAIDVGGTHTDCYIFTKAKEATKPERSRHSTPNNRENLVSLVKEIIKRNSHMAYILIGLPGPIRKESDEVHCPPLGVKLLKSDFQLTEEQKSKIIIVNDLACLASILFSTESTISRNNAILLTIGTSLGIARLETCDNLRIIDTYESAHMRISHEANKCLRSYSIDENVEYCHQILNAKFLIRTYKHMTETFGANEYWESFFPAMIRETLNLSIPFQPVTSVFFSGGFVDWLCDESFIEKAEDITKKVFSGYEKEIRIELLPQDSWDEIRLERLSGFSYMHSWQA
jgi:hypothetical protein